MTQEDFLRLCRQYKEAYLDFQRLPPKQRRNQVAKESLRQMATAILLRMAFEFATQKLED